MVGGANCVRGPNTYDDGTGHGTRVAGTAAAKDTATASSVIRDIDYVTANAHHRGGEHEPRWLGPGQRLRWQ